MLHGGLVGSPAEMGELADHLKDNHQVILIATRGHGRSEIGHTTMSFEQKADDVHAVLKDASIKDKVDVIGFSMAAILATILRNNIPTKSIV